MIRVRKEPDPGAVLESFLSSRDEFSALDIMRFFVSKGLPPGVAITMLGELRDRGCVELVDKDARVYRKKAGCLSG